ncbi:MAG: hypothetical protein AAB276_00795 [Pseudomonadota bacterium]
MNEEIKFHEVLTLSFSLILLLFLFPSIISSINAHNGAAQVLMSAVTLFFAYWIPHSYRKNDELRTKQIEIYNYTEAIVRSGLLLEDLMAISDVIIKIYNKEKQQIEDVVNAKIKAPSLSPTQEIYIDNFELILSKCEAGRNIDISIALLRVVRGLRMYNELVVKRNERISKSLVLCPIEEGLINCRNINYLTLGLIHYVEVSFNNALFAQSLFRKFAEAENLKLSAFSLGIKVIDENILYGKRRVELENILKSFEEFYPRHTNFFS